MGITQLPLLGENIFPASQSAWAYVVRLLLEHRPQSPAGKGDGARWGAPGGLLQTQGLISQASAWALELDPKLFVSRFFEKKRPGQAVWGRPEVRGGV